MTTTHTSPRPNRPNRRGRTSGSTTIPSPDNRVSAEVDARLTTVLERTVARRGIHHTSIAIVSGDQTRRWSGASGDAGPTGAPLRPDTPFFVASITKRFIITLLLQAHERGELHLDEPLTAHLPNRVTAGLHVYRGIDHTARITLRHLASHTSGLPDYFDKPRQGTSLFARLAAGQDLNWTFEDVVRMAREDHRPHFPPQDLTADRQRARYSDTGFQLLIRVLESATGRSFPELLTERILEPLELRHTWLPGRSQPAAPTDEPASIYVKDRPLDVPGMVASSNDLMSTTADLLRFQRALLDGELFTGPTTVPLLTERENLLRNALPLRYGLGTMTFRVNRLGAPGLRPLTLLGHSGATGTWLFHCPQLDVHLAGTVDQAKGRAIPFRLMATLLRAW
jgi:D-alanyl-D-alanine carboxypeptidase